MIIGYWWIRFLGELDIGEVGFWKNQILMNSIFVRIGYW